jgi:hypothetical protein
MELCVLHYHFRPGGVRRVIELGLPALVRATGCTRVTLAAGEAPDNAWRTEMESALHPCAVAWHIEPALGYWSELNQPAMEVRAAIRASLHQLVKPGVTFWAHNLSVGRNLLLAQELAALPPTTTLWLHHHDWWWDGRWERWPEMQTQGFKALAEAVQATLPLADNVRHFCVNLTDAHRLTDWTGAEFRFLPNPLSVPRVTPEEIAAARDFLRRRTGADSWWINPCRALRRKNIAEAIFVQQTFARDAATVTTGGPSSAAEGHYYNTLTAAAASNGWPLHAGIATHPDCPPVPALMAAADTVIITSLREGFGLPYCEAALLRRPCRARIPHGLESTLHQLGVPFAEQWHTLPVPPHYYNQARETAHFAAGHEKLRALLPEELHETTRTPLPPPEEMDFGRLSLAGQLEALSTRIANPGGHRVRLPASAAPFNYAWTPEVWARDLLRAEMPGSPHTDWPQQAPAVIAPLLRHWLEHPLLWP